MRRSGSSIFQSAPWESGVGLRAWVRWPPHCSSVALSVPMSQQLSSQSFGDWSLCALLLFFVQSAQPIAVELIAKSSTAQPVQVAAYATCVQERIQFRGLDKAHFVSSPPPRSAIESRSDRHSRIFGTARQFLLSIVQLPLISNTD